MKRRYVGCPNPLFEKWLEEWKEEAMKKNTQLQHSFGKALTSLRKYPLPLASGKECVILQYFGSKLCNMLDNRLEKYRILNNLPAIPADNIISLHNEDGGKKKKEDKKKVTEKNQNKELEKNKKNQKSPKEPCVRASIPYIPKVGSASYAILVTIYKKSQDPDYPGYMLKKDIISEAQADCECLMKGTALEHYSGWSSMAILIEKNFVVKKSCPAKFCLTDAGIALAMSLYEGSAMHLSNSSDDDNDYVGNNLEEVKQSSNTSNSFLKKAKNSGSKSSNATNTPPLKTKSTGSTSTNAANSPALKTKSSRSKSSTATNSPPFKTKSSGTKSSKSYEEYFNEKENEQIIILDDDDDDDVFLRDATEKTDDVKIDYAETIITRNVDKVETTSLSNSDEDFDKFCMENIEPVITVRNKQPHFIFTEPLDPPGHEIQPECSTAKKKAEEVKKGKGKDVNKPSRQKKASVEDAPTESFFLLANNFDVILLVDTQETCGGKTRPKDDATISELSKLGILFEVRSLKVGDFTWIARCRLTNRELVLSYIIERKRMDDLACSIKDGRYREQKFRLRQCGLKNVIYMVESYGKNYHGSLPLTTLLQASVNSLIHDDFMVKYTRDHRDSMRYLGTMTTMLTKIYEGKELWSCSKKDLETTDSNTGESTGRLMEFNEFNRASAKTKNFTVQQMLIRMLLQLKGISVEKAVAIATAYPTPKILAKALKDGGENLLANLETGPTKRKLGPAISKTLHQLYTRHTLT